MFYLKKVTQTTNVSLQFINPCGWYDSSLNHSTMRSKWTVLESVACVYVKSKVAWWWHNYLFSKDWPWKWACVNQNVLTDWFCSKSHICISILQTSNSLWSKLAPLFWPRNLIEVRIYLLERRGPRAVRWYFIFELWAQSEDAWVLSSPAECNKGD